jgi:DNA-binding HxlR family transcriptional regulator
MQRTSFADMECPIAAGADLLGEAWTLLILRDALDGFTRFDDFQRDLGIAPNTLTRRLSALVDAGLLERRRYTQRPPRDEYVLTARGRDVRPIVVALYAFADRHLGRDAGRSLLLVDQATGAELDPVLVDRASGTPIAELDAVFAPGPAAGTGTRAHHAAAARRRNDRPRENPHA